MGTCRSCCQSVDPNIIRSSFKDGELQDGDALVAASDEADPRADDAGSDMSPGGGQRRKDDTAPSGDKENRPNVRPKSVGKNAMRSRGRGDPQGDNVEERIEAHRQPREKDEETRDLIRNGIKSDRVCSMFEESEFDTILETMEYFTFKGGETIIKQGEEGMYFFVTHEGTLEVSVNGNVLNTICRGAAFGSLALLYQCPRTATVTCKTDAGVWACKSNTFHMVLQEMTNRNQAANRKFIDSISLFDGLTPGQKELVGGTLFTETFDTGQRVVTEGEAASAIYFVKRGELRVLVGAQISDAGNVSGGQEISRLRAGDCFGERAVLYREPRGSTVVAECKAELLVVGVEQLKEALGEDLATCLERNFILAGLRKSPVISLFSASQQSQIVRFIEIRELNPDAKLEGGLRFVLVMDGELVGMDKICPEKSDEGTSVSLSRGQFYEDDAMIVQDDTNPKRTASAAIMALDGARPLSELAAGQRGCKLACLTQDALAKSLKELGLAAIGSAEQAIDYTRKMILTKKVPIFRHLSHHQIDCLVKAFFLQKYEKGANVIKQGELGTSFFVIASGEVRVLINGDPKRVMGKNGYIGERALLFDEPRSATVEVISDQAELWSVEKSTFAQIVKGNMQDELTHRIRLQDTNVTLKDVRNVIVIGQGAAGVVRLVEHTKTKMRYALKRVRKEKGKIPEEVQRECDLMAEMDHPFVVHLVKTFETKSSVYMLQEVIPGGELHAAMRTIPHVLNRAQAQFYTGSIVLVLESLKDRNIVYRDLKPENVMLDAQGYLKLIDFGIAKKLDENKSKTFTMIGTPHYMAPEVMRGHGYSTEVDIWSLGVMQFEFVCGFLPFADDLDDPTEVCTAVLKDQLKFPPGYKEEAGKALMKGLLTRQPKKRLGSGVNGYDEIKESEYFRIGVNNGADTLFNKIMGRELDAPVVNAAEVYGDPEDLADVCLSDENELAK